MQHIRMQYSGDGGKNKSILIKIKGQFLSGAKHHYSHSGGEVRYDGAQSDSFITRVMLTFLRLPPAGSITH